MANTNTEFCSDGAVISDPVEIAERFCSYFTNIGENLRRNLTVSSIFPKEFLKGEFSNSFFLKPICEYEIREAVNSFKSGKATGSDKIPMGIIKQSIDFISLPLTHIVNLSFMQGIVPDQLKIVRVIPVFKLGDQTEFTNYRPISILPAFSKIFERLIFNQMFQYMERYNILNDQQYGFRRGRSTSLALIELHDKIHPQWIIKKLLLDYF